MTTSAFWRTSLPLIVRRPGSPGPAPTRYTLPFLTEFSFSATGRRICCAKQEEYRSYLAYMTYCIPGSYLTRFGGSRPIDLIEYFLCTKLEQFNGNSFPERG